MKNVIIAFAVIISSTAAFADGLGCWGLPHLTPNGQLSVPSIDGQGEIPITLGKAFDLDVLTAVVQIRQGYSATPRVDKSLCMQGKMGPKGFVVDSVSVK